MRPLLLNRLFALLALLLICGCQTARPALPPEEATPRNVALDAPSWLSELPTNLTPRQQRKAVRTAGKALARIAAAQHPPAAAPLLQIASGNVKSKADNRGSDGGTYAPGKRKERTRTVSKQGQRAAGGVAIGPGAKATGATKLNAPWWLWLLLIAVIGWLVRRFWPG